MAKTIYRICLIVCLTIAIWAGFFYYQKGRERQKKLEELTLVQHTKEDESIQAMELQEVVWKGVA